MGGAVERRGQNQSRAQTWAAWGVAGISQADALQLKRSKWAAGLEGFPEEEWDPLAQSWVGWSPTLWI